VNSVCGKPATPRFSPSTQRLATRRAAAPGYRWLAMVTATAVVDLEPDAGRYRRLVLGVEDPDGTAQAVRSMCFSADREAL
jgi:hypothetical protein